MIGDLNGDGKMDIADALWALRLAVGLEALSSTHIITGDLNGDGRINSADAVLLQRMAANFDKVNPLPMTLEGLSDPLLLANILNMSVPVTVRVDNEQAVLGTDFCVAVRVDNAQGLSGYDVTLRYDEDLLDLVEVRAGTVVGNYPQQWEEEDGRVRISMGRREALYELGKAFVDGTLATVCFHAKDMPDAGAATQISIEGVPALMGQYGDSYEWFTAVLKVHGQVRIQEAIDEEGEPVEGEPAEGEGEMETIEEIAAFLLDNFDTADVDDDSRLSFDEACEVLSYLTQEQFNLLDANSDGFLTREELETFLDDGRCGCCRRGCTPEENVKRYLGDWLLLGLALLMIVAFAQNNHQPR